MHSNFPSLETFQTPTFWANLFNYGIEQFIPSTRNMFYTENENDAEEKKVDLITAFIMYEM